MIAHVPSAVLDRKSCWSNPTQTSSEVIRIVINSIRIHFLVIDSLRSLRSLSEWFPNARFGRVKPGTQPNSFHLLSDCVFWTFWTGIFLKQKTFGANQSTITLYGPVGIFCRFDAVHLRRCLNREISDYGKVVASWRNWAKLFADGAWRAWLKGVWRHGDIQRASHMCFIKVEVQASFLWNSWDLHIWKISGQVFQYLELVSSWNHRQQWGVLGIWRQNIAFPTACDSNDSQSRKLAFQSGGASWNAEPSLHGSLMYIHEIGT